MTSTYTYDALTTKYDNFLVTGIKICVKGRNVVELLDLNILEVKVILSLKASSMVTIKIGEMYDMEKQMFDKKVVSLFKLGTIVEVELGYGTQTTQVFKGFVYMIGSEFDKSPLFTLTLMDVRRLMMESGQKNTYHQVKNYSDAFKKVISNYSKLCSPVVDATNDKLENPLSQMTDDYDFIVEELIHSGRTDREFFILGDKAYFREQHKVKLPIMTLEYGQALMKFKVDAIYQELRVNVIGYNPVEQKQVVASSSIKSSERMTSLTNKKPIMYHADAEADSLAKAKIRAKAIAEREKYKKRVARGTAIGLPEIVPGRYIKITGLDPMFCKKYYVSEVVHIFNTEQFITHFEIEGWE